MAFEKHAQWWAFGFILFPLGTGHDFFGLTIFNLPLRKTLVLFLGMWMWGIGRNGRRSLSATFEQKNKRVEIGAMEHTCGISFGASVHPIRDLVISSQSLTIGLHYCRAIYFWRHQFIGGDATDPVVCFQK